MNLKTLKKDISRDYIKRIKNLKVRECDEEEPRSYVAYVDEGDKSYDVSVELNKKLDVLDSNCDCDEGSMLCNHQISLFEHLKNLLVKPVKKTRSKKAKANSEILDLLASVPGPALFDWLQEVFIKNKEVEIDFRIKFTNHSDQNLNIDQFIKKSDEVIKSFVGRKHTIEPQKVKSIIDLWKKIHQPYFDAIFIAPDSNEKIKKYSDLYTAIMKFTESYFFQGKRLEGYLKLRHKEFAKSLSSLNNKTEFFKIFKQVFDKEGHPIIPDVFEFLGQLLELLTPVNKELLLKNLFEEYTKISKGDFYNIDIYTRFLYAQLENDALKRKYFSFLLPIRYANDYNCELLDHLVSMGNWLSIQNISEWIISTNYYEVYNLPYYLYLKTAYKELGKEKKRIEILKILVPLNFNFDDFLEVLHAIEDEKERKKYRSGILAKASNRIYNVNKDEPLNFRFRLMDYENNYKKLIEYIPSSCPVYLLEPFWKKLLKHHTYLILDIIFEKLNGYDWDEKKEVRLRDREIYPRLYEILLENVSYEELKYYHLSIKYIQKRGDFSFARFVDEKLQM